MSDSLGGSSITPQAVQEPLLAVESRSQTRLLSLDAFRGLVIVLMFLVDIAGDDRAFYLGTWAPENYQCWMPHMGFNGGRMGNGLADYVFPWFLFIVGVATPFSMRSGRGKGKSWGMHMLSALRRGVILYLLGSLMFAASIGYRPDGFGMDPSVSWSGPIDARVLLHWDILPLLGLASVVCVACSGLAVWMRLTIVIMVMVFKWATLKLGVPSECASWVQALEQRKSLNFSIGAKLGLSGWWSTMLTQGSAFSAIAVLGTCAGDVLQNRVGQALGATRSLLIAGGVGCVMAICWWLLGDMPFSKDFVSPTYILITSGSAAIVLAIAHEVIDVRRWTTVTALRVLGTNALAIYLFAELAWKTSLIRWQVVLPPTMQPANLASGVKPESSMAFAAMKAWLQYWTSDAIGSYLVVAGLIFAYWLVALALYRRKWFIKV